MKYKSTREGCKRQPNGNGRSKSGRIRVPRDYPWKVLNMLHSVTGQHLGKDRCEVLGRIIRNRDLDQYLELSSYWGLQSINSNSNCDSGAIPDVMIMLSSLVKKFQFEGDASLRRDKAIELVLSSESKCKAFNRKGRALHGSNDPVLRYARRFCAMVLGENLPSWEDLTRSARHGPGASSNTSKGKTTAYDKYVSLPYDVTPRCYELAKQLIHSDERWVSAIQAELLDVKRVVLLPTQREFWDAVLTTVPGNRITTVPKDARKDRPIAIEPTMNMMLQLGVDGFIRRRLKRWGINLDDQSKNQRLAYEGSLRQDVLSPATIDLSAASDMISLRCAQLLLPRQWFQYVYDIRSPRGELPDGRVIRFRKLSSMGNGSTFAIESLLFAAVLYGCCKACLGYFPRDMVSVFGDDIICPEGIASDLCHYLQVFGFSINTDKSFLEGCVKESCGTDWYRGQDMRPVHLTEMPRDVTMLIQDRNRIFRWLSRHGYNTFDQVEALDTLFRRWIPGHYWLEGPYSDDEFSCWIHTSCESWRKTRRGTYVSSVLRQENRSRRKPRNFWLGRLCLSLRERPIDSLYTRCSTHISGNGHVMLPLPGEGYDVRLGRRTWYSLPGSYLTAAEQLRK